MSSVESWLLGPQFSLCFSVQLCNVSETSLHSPHVLPAHRTTTLLCRSIPIPIPTYFLIQTLLTRILALHPSPAVAPLYPRPMTIPVPHPLDAALPAPPMPSLRTPSHPPTSILALPTDVFVYIVNHLPRRTHLPLLDAIPKIRPALLHYPRNVLTELDLLPTAALDDRPPVFPASHPTFLQHVLYTAAGNLRVLRLHAAVPAATTTVLLTVAAVECPRLEHLAFRDGGAVDDALCTMLFESLRRLKVLEVAQASRAFLLCCRDLPPRCDTVQLVKAAGIDSSALLLALQALSKTRAGRLDLRLNFTYNDMTIPEHFFEYLKTSDAANLAVLRRLSVYCRSRLIDQNPIFLSKILEDLKDLQDVTMTNLSPQTEFTVGVHGLFARTLQRSSATQPLQESNTRIAVSSRELQEIDEASQFPNWLRDVGAVFLSNVDLSRGDLLDTIRRGLGGVHTVVVDDNSYFPRRGGNSRLSHLICQTTCSFLQNIPPISKLSLPRYVVKLGGSTSIARIFELCAELQELHLHENINTGIRERQIRSIAMSVEAEKLPSFLDTVGKHCKRLACVYVQEIDSHMMGNISDTGLPLRSLSENTLEKATLAVDRLEEAVPGVNVITLRSLIQSWSFDG